MGGLQIASAFVIESSAMSPLANKKASDFSEAFSLQ
jgi:predicted XRE-type DNA-binding protein